MRIYIVYIVEILVFLFGYVIIFKTNNVKILKFVAIVINTCLILELINKIRTKVIEKQKMKMDKEKERLFYNYYKIAKENNENASMIKHDLKNQIQIAYAMESKNNKLNMISL